MIAARCYLGRMAEIGNISCAVNPSCGREQEYRLTPTYKRKKVVVIGGGVAGMEAARIAADRGHDVVLIEKASQLGGNVIPGCQPAFKHDDKLLLDWFEGELIRHHVDVRFNTEANKQIIDAEHADAVIFATGSRPVHPEWIAGIDQPHVMKAEQMLMNPALISGEKLTVIGGGLVGAEAALWMAQQGKRVTLIEASNDIIGGPHGTCFANYQMLKELLAFNHVDVKTSTFLKEITTTGVNAYPADNVSNIMAIDADHVVLAMGYKSNQYLFDELANQLEVDEVYNIGDSQSARTIMAAIWDGYEVARNL